VVLVLLLVSLEDILNMCIIDTCMHNDFLCTCVLVYIHNTQIHKKVLFIFYYVKFIHNTQIYPLKYIYP
jgi:hypothetical protein